MSTSYIGVCDEHRLRIHVGQRMGGQTPSFGFGSRDELGRMAAATFLFKHAWCSGGARVVPMDSPDRPEHDYDPVDDD